jgi:hypothetical protein
MSSIETMSDEQFERHALEVLGRELGADGLARFLRLHRSGPGDYTKDRMQWQKELTIQEVLESIEHRRQLAVPELCQNPICLGCRELLFEREQLPQVVDNRHFRIELMECLEPEIILRNQQVAGSIPAGGSSFSMAPIHCPSKTANTN